jgi:uncharacterized OsmC-like protein
MSTPHETVLLRQARDYQFDIDFGNDLPPLRADEPPPLGQGSGPSPAQLLASAVGDCLCASMLFAWRKFRQDPGLISCQMQAETGRNADKRLRVLAITARLTLGVPARTLEFRERVLGSFESYCTVTQSINAAIPVHVEVFDAEGEKMK